MAYNLVQAGTTLYSVSPVGGVKALTMPPGITLVANRVPRFARFNGYVIVTNTPTRPILVGPDGTVYPLTPTAPNNTLILSGQSGGALSGTYLALQTFVILDASGNIITESPFSPLMTTPVTIASQYLRVDGMATTPDLVSAARLYRTATGPTISYFHWVDANGNILVANSTPTSVVSDLSDAGLSTIAAPILGAAPDLTLVCAYQGRVFGVDRLDVDHIRFTESGTSYQWNAFNSLPVGPTGDDASGITALIPRRNSLGIARKDAMYTLTGSSLLNYTIVSLNGDKGGPGVSSQESVVVYKDRAFFLWKDGVYTWDANGINSISDGKVRSWFTSNTYFNRAAFWRSFAVFDMAHLRYRLYLCSAGSRMTDRWIEYDLTTGAWFGPHKTDAFSPSCAMQLYGGDQNRYTMVGSQEGYISMDQSIRNDWGILPIAIDVTTKGHDMQTPELEKYWGELEVFGPAQPVDLVNPSLVSVTPTVGDLNAAPQAPFSYDMTKGRQRLGRLGVGKTLSLRFQHATLNEDVELYGYQVPANVVGKR